MERYYHNQEEENEISVCYCGSPLADTLRSVTPIIS